MNIPANFNGDDKNNSGWGLWANMVISNLTTLDKELSGLKEELRSNISKLYDDIKAASNNLRTDVSENRQDIVVIKIALEELKRIDDKIANIQACVAKLEDLTKTAEKLKLDIAKLQVRASIWGGLGGILSAIATALIYIITKKP